MRTCHNCGLTVNIEKHHVFYGTGQRKISDKNGFFFDLCSICHRSQPQGVHGGNRELDLRLKREKQEEYEQTHTRAEFMKLIGRNYRGD